MSEAPKSRIPLKNGWESALTSKSSQIVFDSYKNRQKGIILMSEIDWVLALGLELDSNIVRYRYVRDPYWRGRQEGLRWRFISKPRNGCTYLIEVIDRVRRKGEKKSNRRRQLIVYLDDIQSPEVILSNADACAYLVAAWDHDTIALENKIFGLLQDGVVRTLRELFQMVGGNHPIFVAALLRQYQSGSIDTNLSEAPLGWLTYVAAHGRLKHA